MLKKILFLFKKKYKDSNLPGKNLVNQEPFFNSQSNWGDGYLLAKQESGGVIVGPGADNKNVFAQIFPIKEYKYFHLFARARSIGKSGKAIFQINWLGANSEFISTSQHRFDVDETEVSAEYRVRAPDDAFSGVIYVVPGGRNNVVEYFEMSVFIDFNPLEFNSDIPAYRFPSNIIHLSDPLNWSQFDNLFRGYDDEVFLKNMIRQVVSNTMVTYDGLIGLLNIVRHSELNNLVGDYVEIGCWKGGCSGLMALGVKQYGDNQRHIRIYDSFQGLPQANAEKDFDGFLEPMFDLDESNSQGKLEPINALVADEDDVRNLLFKIINYPEKNVSIYKGWFQETIPVSSSEIEKIAILRLDGDFYDSYVVALEYLYPKVVKGGFVIIDDWVLGGCRKAVTEYFEKNGLKPFLWPLDATTRCFQVN